MSKLEFALKKSELEKAFKEQERTGRVVLSIPLSEDDDGLEHLQEMYDPYVAAYKHRGELGFAEIVSKKKEDGRMVDMGYDVRIIAARLTKKEYQIEVRFTDFDLFT
jgi:hypothetical protein